MSNFLLQIEEDIKHIQDEWIMMNFFLMSSMLLIIGF